MQLMQSNWLIPTVFGLGAVVGFGLGFIVRALISRHRRRAKMAGWSEIAASLRFTPPAPASTHPHADAA